MGRVVRRKARPSWLSSLRGAIKGVVFGLIVVLAASWLLFWNEGRAVRRYQGLAEGQGVVMPAASDRVDPANEGKLVHISGEATTEEVLSDEQFGIRIRALRLKRVVDMYQWAESRTSESREVEGGQTETVITYSYGTRWSPELIDSGRFQDPVGHQNPAGFPVASRASAARNVRIGAFRLSEGQVRQIGDFMPVDIMQTAQLAGDLKWRAKLLDGGVYVGRDPSSPAIGDVKIRFEQVPFTPVSIVARQTGETFEPYYTGAGEPIELLRNGLVSHEAMFQSAQQGNRTNTWILRFVGLLMMYFAVARVLRPVVAALGIIPVVGDAVSAGTRLISLLLAGTIALVVISAGWMYYRPALAVVILVCAAGTALLFLLFLRRATSRGAQTTVP